jgi:hypothetical protein
VKGKLFPTSLLMGLFVSGLALATLGYENLSNFTGWCISIVPSEHELYLTNLCNTEYVASVIVGAFALSLSILALTQTALAQTTLITWEELKLGSLRLFTAVGLVGLGFLFFFFVPIIPNTMLFPCSSGTFGGLCLSNTGGLESIGFALLNWGAIYGFELGYFAPVVAFPTYEMSGWAVLEMVALPVLCVCTVLLYPRIAHVNRWLLVIPLGLALLLFFSPFIPGFSNA